MPKNNKIIKMASYGTSSTTPNQVFNEIKSYLQDNFISAATSLISDETESKKIDSLAQKFAERASKFIEEKVALTCMKNKLDLLFEYEKHYLSLIKEYKEEIKFASSLQEDLRKERANFFSATLREVYATLQATKVGPEMETLWLQKLVASYTESLDLSAELAKENTLNRVSELKEDANNTKDNIENQ